MINTSRSSDQHGARLQGSSGKKATALVPRDGFRARSAVKQSPTEGLHDLESCERVMKESFQRFAEAVARIKNKKLFLEAGYSSFVEYCQERWGWTASRGYQIVEALNQTKP